MNESTSSQINSDQMKLPIIAAGFGLFLLVAKFVFKKLFGRKHVRTRAHFHEAVEHDHEHVHVTHNRTDPTRGVGGWEHLTATHRHRHNHAAVEHTHRPHRNLDAEHRHEAHVHDHEHPLGEHELV